jgi:hypothetical protein
MGCGTLGADRIRRWRKIRLTVISILSCLNPVMQVMRVDQLRGALKKKTNSRIADDPAC